MTAIKKNHHYVPQFWLRAFADVNGSIHAWDGQMVRVVSSKRIMQTDWLYTLFDNAWQPSDALEDALARVEGTAAPVLARLCDPNAVLLQTDRQELCDFLALQACRHPDIMRRGHKRARELGALIASAHSFKTPQDFAVAAAKFGIIPTAAHGLHTYLCAQDAEQLRLELDELNSLSPQDAQLPEQEALRAQSLVAQAISGMTITLLDAPAGSSFVLGDTPMPQDLLGHGFTVPLSSTVAVEARMGADSHSAPQRRPATAAEVVVINQTQWGNALHIVIGADPQALQRL